jgi:hypothetical protein
MAIVAIHSPGLDDAVGISIFARSSNMIDDTIGSAQLAFAHSPGDLSQGLIPTDAFPFPFTAFANSLQGIKDAFRVIDLIMRRGSLSTVSAAASRVNRIAFELANLESILVYIGEKPTGRFTVEADGRHERISPRDALRPFLAIPFDPVIPYIGWRILADAPIGMNNFSQFDGFASEVANCGTAVPADV